MYIHALTHSLTHSLTFDLLSLSSTVCDDHHFKDEYLFYRFKNDEKGKGLNLRDRLNSKKGSKRNRSDDDTSSIGDGSDHRASSSSFDSQPGSVGGSHSPEQDE